ncbi:MAG: Gfo/Idh/MocA family oxidoreductase, partial [Planctomycetales bacterium]
MSLTPEETATGRSNFNEAVNALRGGEGDMLSRRDFIAASAVAAAVPTASLGTFYFGYSQVTDPVRVGVIGTGDEGGVLISNISPEYLQVVAISDIRPYNQWRAFHGDHSSPGALAARQGLMSVYGWKDEKEAKSNVKLYEDYKDLLKDPNIEAVIIAVPLVMHHQLAMDALKAGKHVLTEKLMAKTIGQCKELAQTSKAENLLLATGHQRHYSVLYDNAVHTIRNGLIGKIHHIRAQWHRGMRPGKDGWKPLLPAEALAELNSQKVTLAAATSASEIEAREKRIFLLDKMAKDTVLEEMNLSEHGFDAFAGDKEFVGYSAVEELVRWRLWNRTGGGLMAELGSHQLDA